MLRLVLRCWNTTVCLAALVLSAEAAAPPLSPAQARPRPRITRALDETARVSLRGNVHPLARAENDEGAADASLPMEQMLLTLQRSPEQEQALEHLIDALHDKHSPSYRRWLTPEQVGERFGAASEDLARITAWLESHGFRVEGVSKGRTVVAFSGNAAQVAEAFHTQIRKYQVEGELHYANSGDPQIPAALAPVVAGVASLHNFPSQTNGRVAARGYAMRPFAGSRAQFNFGSPVKHTMVPHDFFTIYNVNPLLNGATKIDGAGQSIAVVGRSQISPEDIRDFRSTFLPEYPANNLQIIVNGPDPGAGDPRDAFESTLDVEWAGAVAPAATVKFVTSASTNTSDGVALSMLYVVENNTAPVMSTSYGLCERAMGAAYNQFLSNLWEQAAAEGITSVVSAGDSGAAGCDSTWPSGDSTTPATATNGLAVNGFASTAYNVAVGGLQFNDGGGTYWSDTNNPANFSSALGYIPESIWNASCAPGTGVNNCSNANAFLSAGGGGASNCATSTTGSTGAVLCRAGYAKPSWQSGLAGVPADGARDLPDVSLAASGSLAGYAVCYQRVCATNSQGQFGFYIAGGTSASAPAFAGAISLVNEKVGGPLGQANYILYKLAAQNANSAQCNSSASPAASCVFYDVTAGTNAVPCAGGSPDCSATSSGSYGSTSGFNAAPGYDLASGIGSVNIANLVNQWSTVSFASTSTTLSLPSGAIQHGQPVTLTFSAAPQNGQGTPTGTVAIMTRNAADPNSVSLGVFPLSQGTGTVTVTNLPGGSYQVFARYSGDGLFGSSTSAEVAVNVAPEASATTLTALTMQGATSVPISTLPYGSPETIRADVAGASGHGLPTGSVHFTNSGGVFPYSPDTLPLTSGGYAALITNNLPPGSYSVAASYSGDHSFLASASTAVNFAITRAVTTAGLASSPARPAAASPVTLTATIGTRSFGHPPTGTAAFFVGSSQVGAVPVAASTDPATGASIATAQLTLANGLPAGSSAITVSYSGDANYEGSTSPVLALAATSATAQLSLNVNPNPLGPNQSGTVTVTITGASNLPVPTGTVTISSPALAQSVSGNLAGGAMSGSIPADLNLAPGNYAVTATYSGDSVYGSASAAATLTVSTAATATPSLSLSAGPAPAIAAGDSATVSLTVTPQGGFAGAVNLSCSVTGTEPSQSMPSCSVASSVDTTQGAVTTPVRISTAKPSSAVRAAQGLKRGWLFSGGSGAVLACTLLIGLPLRRRGWRAMLALAFFACAFAGFGCGSAGPGASPNLTPAHGTGSGTYSVVIQASDAATGKITAKTTLTLTVQ